MIRRCIVALSSKDVGTQALQLQTPRYASSFKPNRGTGDDGTSALFTGERRPKTDSVFEVLGTSDELSSWLGFARRSAFDSGNFDMAHSLKQSGIGGLSTGARATVSSDMAHSLKQIQCTLQDLNACVATPSTSATKRHEAKTDFEKSRISELDLSIDELSAQLPPLRQFILAGGCETACRLHIARSVCRRLERRMVALVLDDDRVGRCRTYVNRLSDYLFLASRLVSQRSSMPDDVYRKHDTSA